MAKEITTIIEYAYVKDIVLLPNIVFTRTVDVVENITDPENEGEFIEQVVQNNVSVYKSRISITYDLKDVNGEFVEQVHREHFSDVSETMLSYDEYKAWQADNEANFIAADKLELAGYGE